MEALTENPSSIRVRKLEPWVIHTHSDLAKNEGMSLEEHLRILLKNQALQAQEDFADEMDRHRADIAEKFGNNLPKAEELIHAVREDSC